MRGGGSRKEKQAVTEGFNSVFIERRRKEIGDAMLLTPRMDLMETSGGYCLYCSLAGVRRGDIYLGLENGALFINAEARLAKLPGKIHALEFADAVFKGSVALPPNVDTARITASFANGLLKVALPYVAKKNERIVVKAG